MPENERKDREEFLMDACTLMRDRLVGEDVSEHFGFDKDEVKGIVLESPIMQEFRRLIFKRELEDDTIVEPTFNVGIRRKGEEEYDNIGDTQSGYDFRPLHARGFHGVEGALMRCLGFLDDEFLDEAADAGFAQRKDTPDHKVWNA